MSEKELKDNFEEIMRKKREAEEEIEKRKVEQLREAYLRRTGRREVKP